MNVCKRIECNLPSHVVGSKVDEGRQAAAVGNWSICAQPMPLVPAIREMLPPLLAAISCTLPKTTGASVASAGGIVKPMGTVPAALEPSQFPEGRVMSLSIHCTLSPSVNTNVTVCVAVFCGATDAFAGANGGFNCP